jgi:hypothetical protein
MAQRFIKHGDLVRRKSDPVHTGRVFRVLGERSTRETTCDVQWLQKNGRPIERGIPMSELESAEEWK